MYTAKAFSLWIQATKKLAEKLFVSVRITVTDAAFAKMEQEPVKKMCPKKYCDPCEFSHILNDSAYFFSRNEGEWVDGWELICMTLVCETARRWNIFDGKKSSQLEAFFGFYFKKSFFVRMCLEIKYFFIKCQHIFHIISSLPIHCIIAVWTAIPLSLTFILRPHKGKPTTDANTAHIHTLFARNFQSCTRPTIPPQFFSLLFLH